MSSIEILQKGYVYNSVKSSKVTYKIQKKRPKSWVDLKSMKKPAVHAIMISEDWGFYQHQGVDFNQLEKAVFDTIKGKKLRGASTISQQLVKNLFLTSNRSYLRKYKELVITLYLEKKLTKDKILEIYLNIIEYGKGIYGINKASLKYFSHNAKRLNTLEASFLAMLLPNPKKYSQSFRDKSLSKYAVSTMHSILDKLKMAKVITKTQRDRLKKMKLNFEKSFTKEKRSSKKDQISLGKRSKNSDDGSSYEKHYRDDINLKLSDGPEFDPDAIMDDDSGLDEEFNLE